MRMIPRKRLPHDIPLGIDPSQEYYFITLCCNPRGQNQLAHPDVAHSLFESIKHRNRAGHWYVHFALLMPDHLHVIVSFPESDKRMQTVISKWKEWNAKALDIRWQRDFFEHRLRHDESYREKAEYIHLNPVRAGLVKEPGDWPYVFFADSQFE